MNIEELVDAAVDLRIANLKAREQGILSVYDAGTKEERFHFYKEEDFMNIIKDREYAIKNHDAKFKYKYISIINGLMFFCITNELLFEGDENKIEEEV